MIKRTYAAFIGLGLFVLVGFAGMAQAQIPDNEVLKAQIPFEFVLRDKTYPAGEYSIRQTPEGADSEFILELSSDHGKPISVLFETFSATVEFAPAYPTIQFDKIGERYFLSKVFVANSTEGNEVPVSRMEKKLEKENFAIEKYTLKLDRQEVVAKEAMSSKKRDK